jgi:hypothetical protein
MGWTSWGRAATTPARTATEAMEKRILIVVAGWCDVVVLEDVVVIKSLTGW